eukprot:400955-Rhodomonas_salina.1
MRGTETRQLRSAGNPSRGTEARSAGLPISLQRCYAMPSTELACRAAAMRCGVLRKHVMVLCGQTTQPEATECSVLTPRMVVLADTAHLLDHSAQHGPLQLLFLPVSTLSAMHPIRKA